MSETRPSGTRTAAYVRVSDPQQCVDSQRQVIKAWADGLGIKVSAWFEDHGWARDLAHARPDFQRLMAQAEAGEWDTIVVSEPDRFGTASAREFGYYSTILERAGVELWATTHGNLSADDIASDVLMAVDRSRSRNEQYSKGERVIRGKVEFAKRGEYLGGVPPFAFDVGCFADGAEKWRLVYEGTDLRKRVWADGREERYDGRRTFPAADRTDTLRLVVSRDADKVEWARRTFSWFAHEAVSFHTIARRLNDLGVKPTVGDGWFSPKVGAMLRNPAFIGAPAWGKKSDARFKEYRSGQIVDVPRDKGRVKTGRKKDRADWVAPADRAEAIIDQETWDLAQAKLAKMTRAPHAPKCSAGWLSGILVCGHCNNRLSYWHSKKDSQRLRHTYVCKQSKKFGKTPANKFGCRLHRVPHGEILPIIERYLEETDANISLVLDSGHDAAILHELNAEKYAKIAEYLKTTRGLREFVEASLGESSTMEVDGLEYDVVDVTRAYPQCYEARKAGTEARVKELVEDLRGLVRNHSRLSGMAQEIAEEEIAKVEAELTALRASLERLDHRAVTIRDELLACQERARGAQKALSGDQDRRKAEAVRRVIGRVVCHYRHFTLQGQDRSSLERVTIEPLVGQPAEVGPLHDGGVLSPASAVKWFARTYEVA